jgi:micrococcal nuclease
LKEGIVLLRKKHIIVLILLLLIILSGYIYFFCFSSRDKVYIKQVFDGDTVRTDNNLNIRLIGVDTPEIDWKDGENEYYALEAYNYTRKHLQNNQVYLEYDLEKRDKYDRLLAYLFLPDGTFFNASLLREGYAHLLLVPPNIKYQDLYREMVKEARENRVGIWDRIEIEGKKLPIIHWNETGRYLNEMVIVQGEIIDTYDSGKAVFLNFSDQFKAVIFSGNLNKFDYSPAQFLLNQKVKVLGKVEEYRGLLEIIIDSPEQVLIIN